MHSPFVFIKLVANVCEKRNGTSALNCNGYLTLVLSASSGNSAGQNLGTLADALSESCNVLVIDMSDLVCTELTYLSALVTVHSVRTCAASYRCRGSLFGSGLFGGHDFVIHFIPLFIRLTDKFSFHKSKTCIRTGDRPRPIRPQSFHPDRYRS